MKGSADYSNPHCGIISNQKGHTVDTWSNLTLQRIMLSEKKDEKKFILYDFIYGMLLKG